MGEEKDYKPENIVQYNETESGEDVLDKLVREYICTRSKSRGPFRLILKFIDVACVNAFVLWMLKYPNWQQKKNNRRRLYLLPLGEEMVTPHTRRRLDSGKVDRHNRRAVRITDNQLPLQL